MSAPVLNVLLPKGSPNGKILGRLVAGLELEIDILPEGYPSNFAAQRRDGGMRIVIDYRESADDTILELCEWERPGPHFKEALLSCGSLITVTYRDVGLAKQALQIVAEQLNVSAGTCVVENDQGCILLLPDVIRCMAADPLWTWERREFPEIEGVAPSEWLD